MPPREPNEITDASNDADAKPIPTEQVAYPTPFSPRKLVSMSDDFVEEYRSGPTGPGEVGGYVGRRTKARKEPSGDE